MSPSEAVRAEALFASCLQRSQQPVDEEIRDAVSSTLRRFGGPGCATRVAGEFGEHPETAVNRMNWAIAMVDQAYESGGAVEQDRAYNPN